MDRKKWNGVDLTFPQLCWKMDRAESRLSRNLSSSFWAFTTFVGFHLGFLYTTTTNIMQSFGFPNWMIGIVIIVVGTVLHITSLMSMNKYRSHVQANEKVIGELEEALEDEQQIVEQRQMIRFPSGAGKARKYIFWALWLAEIGIAITFFVK